MKQECIVLQNLAIFKNNRDKAEKGMETAGRSLAETPTWSVASVTTVLVTICFIVERSIHRFGKWLERTKRKPLLAALEKIKEELMLLGLISLILVQTSRWISSTCVKSKIFSSRFYPCSVEDYLKEHENPSNHSIGSAKISENHGRMLVATNHCAKGYEPFVSYESMEQLHRFLFVLGVTHVLYCCLTMLLAMIKIYSWKAWEMDAHSKLLHNRTGQTRRNAVIRRQSTFVLNHTSHPWSKNRVLIWLLCFLRQFVRSVTKSDYTTLRMGFITNHRLRFTYDFHSYMVRTMEDEFRDIVGVSWQLWGYAILCILFNLHGLNFYFWISFIPAILILLLGTKLQHVLAKLALEDEAVVDSIAGTRLKPRDELFWFDKPEMLLWLIQFISFQNAFEMAAFVWSWWQIKAHTCFMKNSAFVYTRLFSGKKNSKDGIINLRNTWFSFASPIFELIFVYFVIRVVVQFWCSYSVLPLYAIVTQMGSRFKKALIAEDIRESLHGWRKRVKDRAKREASLHGSQTTGASDSVRPKKKDDTDDGANGNLELAIPPTKNNLSNFASRSKSMQGEIAVVSEIQQAKCLESNKSMSSLKDASLLELQPINILDERKEEDANGLVESSTTIDRFHEEECEHTDDHQDLTQSSNENLSDEEKGQGIVTLMELFQTDPLSMEPDD